MNLFSMIFAAALIPSAAMAEMRSIEALNCGGELGPKLSLTIDDVEAEGIYIRSFEQAKLGKVSFSFELPNDVKEYARFRFLRTVPARIQVMGSTLSITAHTPGYEVNAELRLEAGEPYPKMHGAFSGTVLAKDSGERIDLTQAARLCGSSTFRAPGDLVKLLNALEAE